METQRQTYSAWDEIATDSQRVMHLALGQNRILEGIAMGMPLEETMTALLRFLESDTPDMLCSVLLLDADGKHLHPCAAPSLPAEYSRALDGAPIGPSAGSCGTAAFRRERVVVADIETDPLWADYRDLVRPHGLRACWSTPIFNAKGNVLGTFAMYFKQVKTPERAHQRIIDTALYVAALAIGKDQREKALEVSEQRYRLINQATNDAIWDWDIPKNTLWWNDAVTTLFGYEKHEITTELDWWTERVHPDDRARVSDSLHLAADSNANHWNEDYRFLRKDGSYAYVLDRGHVMRDASGTTIRMIGSMQDITERKRAEAQVRELAFHEPVTHLPNRAALRIATEHAVAKARLRNHGVGLMLVNLDFFRDINNCLGHQNGDLLLRHVAERLSHAMGPCGEVTALGGDEFAILVPKVTEKCEIEPLVARIREALQVPVQLADIPIRVDATIGIALYPKDGNTVQLLSQHADVALRTAKEKFESHLFYSSSIDTYDPTRLVLLAELRSAIEEGQLLLHYQPKIDLATGRTVAAEALVRWQHPTRGLIYPDNFIPLAERTGLINPLTTTVVVSALRQGVAFHHLGLNLDISVNLSARNLHEPNFSKNLLSLVASTGFPLSQLTLEVTETAIMADPVRAKAVLTQLHEAGIALSMDDFGIGQSSLSYLKELPISKMKIDKSFVMDFDQPRNVAVVRSAVDLARNMGLSVTAEGVETETAYRALKEFGCDLGQGYYFSRPLAVDRLTAWLHESEWGVKEHAAA